MGFCAAGCTVVVMNKGTHITRNNVLHLQLWPFTIEDLEAKSQFYGKFCAGAIDHISEWLCHVLC